MVSVINNIQTEKQRHLQQTDQIVSSKTSQFNVNHTSSSVYRHRWTVFLKFIDPWNIQYLFILTNVQTGRVFDVI